jgi:hypothetical protein
VIFIQLPRVLWRSHRVEDGSAPCRCGRCPGDGAWDTLAVSVKPRRGEKTGTAWTVHHPEGRRGQIIIAGAAGSLRTPKCATCPTVTNAGARGSFGSKPLSRVTPAASPCSIPTKPCAASAANLLGANDESTVRSPAVGLAHR